MPDGIDLRCSTILLRDESVLLIHRTYDGADDWMLPGGTPVTARAWQRALGAS
jgi:8-oxo-dGTP diphosphatase